MCHLQSIEEPISERFGAVIALVNSAINTSHTLYIPGNRKPLAKEGLSSFICIQMIFGHAGVMRFRRTINSGNDMRELVMNQSARIDP